MSIDRFGYRQKNRLAKFAAGSPRLAQLASSFPLLFFALATGYGNARQRALALRMVDDGCKLRDIAAVMELPMALRRVVPAMLIEPLVVARLTDKGATSLASRALRAGPSQRNSVAVGFYGSRLYNEAFGVWLAQISVCDRVRELEAVRAVAIYAWASNQMDDPDVSLGVPPWVRELSLETACDNAREWINRLQWRRYFQGLPLKDHWMRPGSYEGFDIVPLLTMADLKAEIAVMRNCLAAYVPRLISGKTRLYGVRRGKDRLATVEVAHTGDDTLVMMQTKGPGNVTVSTAIFRAVEKWWSDHRPWKAVPHACSEDVAAAERVFIDIVRRYRAACNIGSGFWESGVSLNGMESDLQTVLHDRDVRYGGRGEVGLVVPVIGDRTHCSVTSAVGRRPALAEATPYPG